MFKPVTTTILCVVIHAVSLFAQKDCSHDHLGLIPLPDLGPDTYHGMQGGLYPGGSNERPADHLAACIERVSQIQPLNAYGDPDPNGRVVMMSIGASNPATEFQRFVNTAVVYEPVNNKLSFVNGCEGGIGIQKMNTIDEVYWDLALGALADSGFSVNQVQVIWIEQENTLNTDTVFPAAPNSLVNDYKLLLQVIHEIFPHVQICYVTARAYAGYADPEEFDLGHGLLYPRDYYNGWAVKFLVEKVINGAPGFQTDGPSANIPFITWGSYHWTDGSNPREDGLFLDCDLDVADDGLHLSGQGEYKFGQELFEFFSTDATAAYWFLDQDYSDVEESIAESDVRVYPNPVEGNQISVVSDTESGRVFSYRLFNVQGALQLSGTSVQEIDISGVPAGMYMMQLQYENQQVTKHLIRL